MTNSNAQITETVQEGDEDVFVFQPRLPVLEIDESMKKMLTESKIGLILGFPFLSYLVLGCDYYFTNELPTMAATTIPRNIVYINPDFMMNICKTKQERSFCVAHEILHIFLQHIGRQRINNYDKELFNVAADYCINGYLDQIDKDRRIISRPDFVLYEERFLDKSADEIYHILLNEAGGDSQKALEKYGSAGDVGSGKPVALDDIPDEIMSEAQKEDIRSKIAASLAHSKSAGKERNSLERLFSSMLDPKIPWETLLQDFIVASTDSRYTYQKINNRSHFVIFPSLIGDNVSLFFGVDTSGSMDEHDLNEAATECNSIMETFDSWNLTLMSCDTEATIIDELSSEEGDTFNSIDKNLVGGGGTDMAPMIRLAAESETESKCLVIVTDGFIPVDTCEQAIYDANDLSVIFIVTSNGNKSLSVDGAAVIFME